MHGSIRIDDRGVCSLELVGCWGLAQACPRNSKTLFFSPPKTPASQTIQIPTSQTPTSRVKIVKCEFRHYDFVNAARLVVSIERNAARCKGIPRLLLNTYLMQQTRIHVAMKSWGLLLPLPICTAHIAAIIVHQQSHV